MADPDNKIFAVITCVFGALVLLLAIIWMVLLRDGLGICDDTDKKGQSSFCNSVYTLYGGCSCAVFTAIIQLITGILWIQKGGGVGMNCLIWGHFCCWIFFAIAGSSVSYGAFGGSSDNSRGYYDYLQKDGKQKAGLALLYIALVVDTPWCFFMFIYFCCC